MTSVRGMVAPLGVRDFRRYYLGHTASAFGDTLTPLAVAFAVLHLTGSPADLAVVLLGGRLPVIVLTLVGGALGDRFSRRGVMLVADMIRFLAHGVTALLLLTGVAQLWMLVVLQLVAGMGSALFNPAAVGLVLSLAGKERLQEANSLLAISRSTTSILALAVAGALVATVGPGWAVLIDAGTFLVSAAFLQRLPHTPLGLNAERSAQPPDANPGPNAGPPSRTADGNPERGADPPDGDPGRSVGLSGRAGGGKREGRAGLPASIGAGVAAVGSRSWLWVWIVHVSLTNMIVVSPFLVLGPYVADQHLGGAPAWSAIGIGYAVGGLAGGVVSARWRPRRPMVAALLVFLLMAPLPALLAVPAATWLLVIAAAGAGLQLVVYNVAQTTAVQRDVPEELVARVSSVVMLGALVAAPLGMALAGPAAAAYGAGPVLASSAALTVLFTLATLLVPSVWRVTGGTSPDRGGDVSPEQGEGLSPGRDEGPSPRPGRQPVP
ncbi:MAG: MFS transporter [Nonomuraea sp.]|nr:MFS transporter [Nonomuraea sp.]